MLGLRIWHRGCLHVSSFHLTTVVS
jgi:hypothetical protein